MHPAIRILIVTCSMCCSTIIYSQLGPDSLVKKLQAATAKDTNRAQLLIQVVGTSLFSVSDSTLDSMAHEALQIAEDQQWKRGISLAYQRLGIIESYLRSNYPQAMRYYNLSLSNELSRDKPDSNLLFGTYSNIGAMYFDAGQFKKGLQVFQKALLFVPAEAKGSMKEYQLQLSLANGLAETGNVDSAMHIYEKFAPKLEGSPYYFIVMGSMGQLFFMKKQYAKAIEVLQPVFEFYSGQQASLPKTFVLVNLTSAQAFAGNAAKAVELGHLAVKVADSLNSYHYRYKANGALADAYRAAGKYDKAMEAYAKFIELKDSASSEDKIQEIAFIEAEGEFERQVAVKEVEHKAELRSERNIRYMTIGGASFALLAGGLLFVSYKKRREAQQLLKTSQFNEKLSDTEMKALRSQMNPHFIFNSLNSIADYIDKQDSRTATLYTTRFAKLMRMILENSEKKEVSLADDLAALELYMQLEALRMNNKFTYEIDVDDRINVEETVIPPLLLQPFVENSIWHGLSLKNGEGKIWIRIKKEGEMINCTIEDNGVGRNYADSLRIQQAGPEKKSLGMKITQSRIDIINKLKNTNAGMQLTDLAEGVRVELRLPFELSF